MRAEPWAASSSDMSNQAHFGGAVLWLRGDQGTQAAMQDDRSLLPANLQQLHVIHQLCCSPRSGGGFLDFPVTYG